jgi:PhnB protein
MPGIIPYLMVNGASQASAFYQKAFGAEEKSRAPAEDGKRMMHLDLAINGASVFLMDPFPEHGEMTGTKSAVAPSPDNPSPASIVIDLPKPADVDALYKRAIDAGCIKMQEPEDTFWNARFAMVVCPYGYIWMINAALPQK